MAFGAHGPLDENGRAVAHIGGHGGFRQRFQIHRLAGRVHGVAEVLNGVHQGAVQIKNHQLHAGSDYQCNGLARGEAYLLRPRPDRCRTVAAQQLDSIFVPVHEQRRGRSDSASRSDLILRCKWKTQTAWVRRPNCALSANLSWGNRKPASDSGLPAAIECAQRGTASPQRPSIPACAPSLSRLLPAAPLRSVSADADSDSSTSRSSACAPPLELLAVQPATHSSEAVAEFASSAERRTKKEMARMSGNSLWNFAESVEKCLAFRLKAMRRFLRLEVRLDGGVDSACWASAVEGD